MIGDGTEQPRTLYAVLALTVVALAIRLVGLGNRIFHWDEGRVGYWILRYHETGVYHYRPITHGPFLPIVNDYVFAILPVSDFAARLPVALVGGLLPLAAWLFRDRLRDEAVVALAAFLALNPLLVYYSRFMRNDVLVAAFALVALGLVVRTVDAGDVRYLYPAAASFALAFTTKENALLYLLSYLAAGALLLDHRLVREVADGTPPGRLLTREWPAAVADRLQARYGSVRDGLLRLAGHGAGALVVFLAVVTFFYAPRPDFWRAFGDPATLPDVVETGTVGAWGEFWTIWVGGAHQSHAYLPYLRDSLETLVYGAPVLLVFALIGILATRYGAGRGFTGLVTFAVYWGVASVLGYPLATDIQAPWTMVHAVVPLAIPAAVGVAWMFRGGRQALAREDEIGAGIAALVLLGAVAGVAAPNATYVDSDSAEDMQILQWAQPENDLKTTLEMVNAVARANEGTDVRFYGTDDPSGDEVLFYVENESSALDAPSGGPGWHSRLPLPWYLERYGATVESTDPSVPAIEAAADAPPVVIAYGWNESDLKPYLRGYTAHRHRFKLWGEDVVVFIDESALAETDRAG